MPASDVFERIEKMAGPVARGLVSQFVPQICQGIMAEYLGQIEVSQIIEYVKKDISLWGQMEPEVQQRVRGMVEKFAQKHIEWLTADWAINSIRKVHPRQASLFLNWPEARVWLDKQIAEIHRQVL